MLDGACFLGTIACMSEQLPPKAVGPDGQVLRPASGGGDPLEGILADGGSDQARMPRRVRMMAAAAVALLAVTLVVGVGATSSPSTRQDLEPRAGDQQARQLAEYAADATAGRAEFPPASGPVVATETSSGLWRVTIRSLDGSCWQVLAATAPPEADGTPGKVLSLEQTPYKVEAIHCRFNP